MEVDISLQPLENVVLYSDDRCISLFRRTADDPPWNVLQFAIISMAVTTPFTIKALPFLASLGFYSASFYIFYYSSLLLISAPVYCIQMYLGAKMKGGVLTIFSKTSSWIKGIGVTALMILFIDVITLMADVTETMHFAFLSLCSPFAWENSSYEIASADGLFEQELHFFMTDFLQATDGVDNLRGFTKYFISVYFMAWVMVLLVIAGGKRYMGYTLTFIALSSLLCSVGLMSYGYNVLSYDNPPSSGFYTLDWWLFTTLSTGEVMKYSALALSISLGSHKAWISMAPTMSKWVSKSTKHSIVVTLLLVTAAAGAPHIFLATLSPYLAATATQMPLDWVPDTQKVAYILSDPTLSAGNLVSLMLPKIISELGLDNLFAFMWFFYIFLDLILYQALCMAIIVDNVTEQLQPYTAKYCTSKSLQYALAKATVFLFGFVLGLPLVTRGGIYLRHLVEEYSYRLMGIIVLITMIAYSIALWKQTSIAAIKKSAIISTFILISILSGIIFLYGAGPQEMTGLLTFPVQNGNVYTFPDWAYRVGWLIAVGPLVLGLGAGIMHTLYITWTRPYQSSVGSLENNKNNDDVGIPCQTGHDVKANCPYTRYRDDEAIGLSNSYVETAGGSRITSHNGETGKSWKNGHDTDDEAIGLSNSYVETAGGSRITSHNGETGKSWKNGHDTEPCGSQKTSQNEENSGTEMYRLG